MTSPMERTLKVIKSSKQKYWIVEHYNYFAKKRTDLFNIIDLLVICDCFVGIQVCGTDWKSHEIKLMETEAENTIAWLFAGGEIELWGWRKLKKKRGGKAMVWKPRIADITLVGGELNFKEREE